MEANYINSFLESAQTVFEQMCQVVPSRGELEMTDVKLMDDHIGIKVGLTGQLDGNVIFGLHESVAMQIASAMMGGMPVTEMNEMGESAISELGNMISGNASTILSSQGMAVDITPPEVVYPKDIGELKAGKLLTVPMDLGDMGTFNIQALFVK